MISPASPAFFRESLIRAMCIYPTYLLTYYNDIWNGRVSSPCYVSLVLYRPLSATNTKPSCINGETRVIEFNTEALSARTSRDFLTWIILIHTTTVASFTFTSQICGSIRRYHNRSCITIDAKRDALTFGIIYAFGPVTQEPIPPKWPEFDYRLREVLWRSRRETSSPFQVTNNYDTNGIHCRHAALIFKGEWHLRISFTKVLLWYHNWGASFIGWFS